VRLLQAVARISELRVAVQESLRQRLGLLLSEIKWRQHAHDPKIVGVHILVAIDGSSWHAR
jgi:hypothetical protein